MLQSMGSSPTARGGLRRVFPVLGCGLVFLGCWEPINQDGVPTDDKGMRVCVLPSTGNSAVDIVNVVNGAVDGSSPGGVGEACVPEDDDAATFAGFSENEVNISTEDSRCSSGTCLVNHFRGRASCPEGNLDGGDCFTPSGALVSVPVEPQLPERPAGEAVHCSCRCDGPAQFGPFCRCPGGMACTELYASGDDLVDFGQGSYCTWL